MSNCIFRATFQVKPYTLSCLYILTRPNSIPTFHFCDSKTFPILRNTGALTVRVKEYRAVISSAHRMKVYSADRLDGGDKKTADVRVKRETEREDIGRGYQQTTE